MTPADQVDIHELTADVMGAKGITGVPPELAVDAIRKTAIDFCTQSTIVEFRDKFRTQYNVSDYPIEVPENMRLASMRWAAINGYLLVPNTTSVPVLNVPYWYNASASLNNPNTWFASGQGYTFTMDGREWIYISPKPVDLNCVDEIEWCAALKPTQNACTIPRILAEDWNDAISSGTAYRLCAMPRQEWSNSGLALQQRKEYQMWVARARLVKAQNYTQAPLILTGAYF